MKELMTVAGVPGASCFIATALSSSMWNDEMTDSDGRHTYWYLTFANVWRTCSA
jgi:hypothetical protein